MWRRGDGGLSSATLSVGMRVRVLVQAHKSGFLPCDATVRFIGTTSFKAGEWIGLQLDLPFGKNDGSVEGVRYFTVEPTFGLFVRRAKVTPLPEPPQNIFDEWKGRNEVGDGRVPVPNAATNPVDDPSTRPQHPQQPPSTKWGEDAPDETPPSAPPQAESPPPEVEKAQSADSKMSEDKKKVNITTASGGDFASVVVFGRSLGPRGTADNGVLSIHFPQLSKLPPPIAQAQQQGGAADASGGLLQNLINQVGASNNPFFQSVSSMISGVLGNNGQQGGGGQQAGGGLLTDANDPERPRLGDKVHILKQGDKRKGEIASIVQDDRDTQPYRLLYQDQTLSEVFYRRAEVSLASRGIRPFRGDRVIVMKANDARRGQEAEVIQDDLDAQPYRLRFSDGTLSEVFYRIDQVQLTPDLIEKRRAGTTPGAANDDKGLPAPAGQQPQGQGGGASVNPSGGAAERQDAEGASGDLSGAGAPEAPLRQLAGCRTR